MKQHSEIPHRIKNCIPTCCFVNMKMSWYVRARIRKQFKSVQRTNKRCHKVKCTTLIINYAYFLFQLKQQLFCASVLHSPMNKIFCVQNMQLWNENGNRFHTRQLFETGYLYYVFSITTLV